MFAKTIGLSTAQISFFMASVIFGGLLLQWPVGRLSDRVDRRSVLIAMALATAIAGLVIVAVAERGSSPTLYVAALVYGSVAFTMYSLNAAHINDFADATKLVQVASGLLIAYGLGASVGPILAATCMGRFGPEALFLYIAAITASLGGFALYRMHRRAAKRAEERAPFVAVPASQFTSEQLYTAVRDQMDRDLARLSGLDHRLLR